LKKNFFAFFYVPGNYSILEEILALKKANADALICEIMACIKRRRVLYY
jgi:hypothetical protein